MKEIIVAGVGSCGINLAASYLSLISYEHNLFSPQSSSSSNELNVHFQETQKGSHIARFLFLDQDPFSIDKILSHPQAKLFNQDNLIADQGSAQNIFAIAYYSSNIIDQINDSFRKEIEKCDGLQGIILNHSSIGGTGSGLCSKILNSLCESHPDKIKISNVILPSFNPSSSNDNNTATSLYNTTLGMTQLVENCYMTLFSDNDALFEKCCNLDCYTDRNWGSINRYVSKAISGLTSGSRFKGLQPVNLRKILVNTVPFPRQHFFSSYYFEESYNRSDFLFYCKENVKKNIGGSLKFSTTANAINSYAAFFRGNDYSSSEIEEFNRNSINTHYDWLSKGLLGHANHVDENNKKEATFIHSGNYIGMYMRKLSRNLSDCFRRKSFLHWYTSAGMDEMEILEAESNLNDLESEYETLPSGGVFDEDDMGEEEGDYLE